MQPGDRIASRFEVRGEAARGGMGTVFRARDRRDHRDVALKVLRADATTDLARFEREAAILAGLRHPNIVEYIAHGATPDGQRYLVMEWVEGETLAHRLGHRGLTAGEIVAIAIQLCGALAALHAQGIVHRDVKPSNVMLVGDAPAHVKLVDLGVARPTAGGLRLTGTGVMVGTAGYVAPELVRGATAIDARADLFALGCVLHECFTGTAAFRGDTTRAVFAKVLLHDPPPLRALDPAVPAALDALVSALLARRPELRPASAAAVAEALAQLPGLPDGVRGVTPARSAATTITRAARGGCGILVARGRAEEGQTLPARVPVLADPRLTVAPFAGGLAVVVAGGPPLAARIALAIAAADAAAVVVIAAAGSPEACLDRCARELTALEIAAEASGHAAAGVWIERGAVDGLLGAFRLAAAGVHIRVVGEGP